MAWCHQMDEEFKEQEPVQCGDQRLPVCSLGADHEQAIGECTDVAKVQPKVPLIGIHLYETTGINS